MAHFYGNLKGSRGMATRCGTASSGISVSARSWNGSVTVSMEEENGKTVVSFYVRDGSGTGGRQLFSCPISQLIDTRTVRFFG